MRYLAPFQTRYFISMVLGLAAYAAALILSQSWLADGTQSTTIRALISLLPMLPAIFICGVIIQTIRRLDEMQRKLQFEALVLAFAGTGLMTFSYGFLEGSGLLPKLSIFAVWPLMGTLWAIGLMLGHLRYK